MQNECDFDDELSNLFLTKSMDKFWLKWHKKFSKRSNCPYNVNGCTNSKDIANAFADSFSSSQFDCYSDSVKTAQFLDRLHNQVLDERSTGCFNDIGLFSVEEIERSLMSLEFGKASGSDGLSKESIFYSHPVIFIHLKLLFNMICLHGFVPDGFGVGIIIPVTKDRLGDVCATSNYRPITLSCVLSKVFEYCILHKYEHVLYSDSLQFGFKKNSSCAHAVFVVSQVVEYFTTHGSNVYIASLDASKAFDRVHHIKLFEKLIDRGLPGGIIKILVDWYGKLFATVRWNEVLSEKNEY